MRPPEKKGGGGQIHRKKGTNNKKHITGGNGTCGNIKRTDITGWVGGG